MILTDYQNELVSQAVRVIHSHRMVYLAMETRTGKTPVSILTAYEIAKEIGNPSVLFATKKGIIKSIETTFAELAGDNPELDEITLEVVSFDSLHKVAYQPRRVIIVDEAHSFGAYPKPSLRAVMLAALSRDCIIIYLSATPTPESYSQIYHQLWAASSGSGLIHGYKNFYQWAKDYVKITKRRIAAGREINDYSNANKEKILPYLKELTVSITQKDAGFPHHEVQEHTYWIEMPENIRIAIKSIKKDRIATLNEKTVLAPTAVSVMSKIHQLCSGTVIPEGDNGIGMQVSDHKLDKLRFVLALYRKVAVYYKYIAEREALIARYGDRTTESPQEFEASQDKIFIGQFLSKREGINLYTADAIVMYNIDYAYVSYIQTKNRIMNMNREKIPVLIWLFTKGGIEQSIYEVVKGKKNYTESYFKRTERIR